MRILLVGATGTIGQAIAAAFGTRHDVIPASRNKAHEKVDVSDPDSIRALLKRVGRVDAIVSAAGLAAFKPLGELSDAEFELSIRNKLMGQVNLVRFGLHWPTYPLADYSVGFAAASGRTPTSST